MSKKNTYSRIALFLSVSLLVTLLSACRFTTIRTPEVVLTQVVVIPRNDPTQTPEPPTVTDAPVMTTSNTATVETSNAATESTQTPTNVPAIFAELRLMFWDVGVLYDTNRWQSGERNYMPSIMHLQIPNCVIHEQGPTEPPPIDRTTILGSVEYEVSELLLSGEHVDWYMGMRNADGVFPDGMPTLVVRSMPNQRDDCLADAEIVLATMAQRHSGSPTKNAPASGECPGAPPQQISIGDKAYVCTKSDHVILREDPNRSGDMLRYLAPGTTMTIIGGPSCANNWSWWNVRTEDDVVGWIAEGGDRVDPYFICLDKR